LAYIEGISWFVEDSGGAKARTAALGALPLTFFEIF